MQEDIVSSVKYSIQISFAFLQNFVDEYFLWWWPTSYYSGLNLFGETIVENKKKIKLPQKINFILILNSFQTP